MKLYTCFEKGSLTNGEKLTRQCRKLLWVMVVFTVAWVNLRGFSVVEGNSTNTYWFFLSFLVAESPWTLIKQSQTLTTHNTNRDCRVRFYTFAIMQPLSKQLYTLGYTVSKIQPKSRNSERANGQEKSWQLTQPVNPPNWRAFSSDHISKKELFSLLKYRVANFELPVIKKVNFTFT